MTSNALTQHEPRKVYWVQNRDTKDFVGKHFLSNIEVMELVRDGFNVFSTQGEYLNESVPSRTNAGLP